MALSQGNKQPVYQLLVTWVLMLAVMEGVGNLMEILHVPSMGAIFLEEFVLLTILFLLNHFWLRVPIRLKSDISWRDQLKVNVWPLIIIFSDCLMLFLPKLQLTSRIILFILFALVVGVFEEYLFRGVLLGGLLRSLRRFGQRRIWLAVGLSSLLFGVSHLINLSHQSLGMTVAQILVNLGFGLLASAMYLRTGSLAWPILLHFMDDARVLAHAGLSQHSVGLSTFSGALGGMILLVVYGGIAWWLLRRSQWAEISARFSK